jgi:glycosyltransferase involved in cell wall biosynthesis
MPRFSIVIPTLQRADTLRHALATAAAQTCDEVEVVIQNNGRDPETEAVLRGFDQPWIHHFASDTVVTMTDNWEAALANARGDFITFIGDDDGLFPDACRSAAGVIDRTGAEIVSWHPYCYYWPNYLFPELRNRLIATVDWGLPAAGGGSRLQVCANAAFRGLLPRPRCAEDLGVVGTRSRGAGGAAGALGRSELDMVRHPRWHYQLRTAPARVSAGLASWFASPLSRSYEPRSGDCLPRLAPVLNYDPLVATRTAAQ